MTHYADQSWEENYKPSQKCFLGPGLRWAIKLNPRNTGVFLRFDPRATIDQAGNPALAGKLTAALR